MHGNKTIPQHPGIYLATFKPDPKELAAHVGQDYWHVRLFLAGMCTLEDEPMRQIAAYVGASDFEEVGQKFQAHMTRLQDLQTQIDQYEVEASQLLHKRRKLCIEFNALHGERRAFDITEEEFRADPGMMSRLSDHGPVHVRDAQGKIMATASRGGGFGLPYEEDSYDWSPYWSPDKAEEE